MPTDVIALEEASEEEKEEDVEWRRGTCCKIELPTLCSPIKGRKNCCNGLTVAPTWGWMAIEKRCFELIIVYFLVLVLVLWLVLLF